MALQIPLTQQHLLHAGMLLLWKKAGQVRHLSLALLLLLLLLLLVRRSLVHLRSQQQQGQQHQQVPVGMQQRLAVSAAA
jgi:hypothetical protein